MPHSSASRRHLSFFDSVNSDAGTKAHSAKPPSAHRGYRLRLRGTFHLTAPDGQRLEIGSKKTIALLALLATATGGERWRSWLQEKLWSSREPQSAQAALRRELHRLRKLTDPFGVSLLHADFRVVRLELSSVDVDIRGHVATGGAEFLEGFDLDGEMSFGHWLKEMRREGAPFSEETPIDHQKGVIIPNASPRTGPWRPPSYRY